MSDRQWPKYQVFEQEAEGRPHANAGTVHAPDAEMALMMARDVFVRRPTCIDLWVAPAAAIFSRTAEQLLESDWPEGAPPAGTTERYAVFCKTRQAGTHRLAGEVEAPGPAEALAAALETLTVGQALVWWVVPERLIARSNPAEAASLFAPARDKTYRDQAEYRSVALMYEIKKSRGDDKEDTMNAELKTALAAKLLALADDELILGHRDSEWTGHAPILEEDIAFGNIALDEIGHAKLWYELLADLEQDDRETYPDLLVFFRAPFDWRNAQLVELPKGDWAFTILRQYLFDAAELVRLEALTTSAYRPIAEVATKVHAEEFYHHRHSSAWMRRLGLGTDESRGRLQRALDAIWPYTGQLLAPIPGEDLLIEAGIVPQPKAVSSSWEQMVLPLLAECELQPPSDEPPISVGRERHTEHLVDLLGEMQSVARLAPAASW